jgi:hypothetical protein
MLSKQNYEAFAAILGPYISKPRKECRHTAIAIAEDIATYFAVDNPRFDRERFMEACGALETKNENRTGSRTTTRRAKKN